VRTRALLVLSALVLCLGLSACAERGAVTSAQDEGLYLAAGPVTYQVQISRELNPNDIEDRSYFEGLPAGTKPAGPDEEWFGVWLQVKNESKQPARTASSFQVVDTQGKTYTPVPLAVTNPFAYQPETLQPAGFEPAANSAAREGPTQGSLLLFKIKTSVYQNRPLKLQILSPTVPERVQDTVRLDL